MALKKTITKRNPQANSIIERVHQTLANIIRVLDTESLDPDDPWGGVLSAAMFALRATYHTTTQATPMQLVLAEMQFSTQLSKLTGNTSKTESKN